MQQIVKDKGTIVKSANRMVPQQTILNRYLPCERKPRRFKAQGCKSHIAGRRREAK